MVFHFVDQQNTEAGRRLFNVDLNGQRLLTEFDIVKLAGGKGKALVRGFSGAKADANGNVVISFQKGTAGIPIISAIQVLGQ